MKVALVYDRVNKWGGAERVLLALHQLFPDAPLYTSVYHAQKAKWAKDFQVRTSFLQNFPFAPSSHESYAPLMPLAFEQFDFDAYDVVISVTSEAAKGILTKPHTKHICYCLTPTRYLWSGYEQYFPTSFSRFVTKPLVSYLRTWDKVASSRPDAYFAISGEVQKRIAKYYGRESVVMYPPLMLPKETKPTERKGDYFLVVSRLVAYKRIDLAVKACTKLSLPLVVIGVGAEEGRLKKMAGPTVRFLGALTDEQLVPYYKECQALLFPGNEDFGLTMVEAQSYGAPVIAYNAGGAKEIIQDQMTGLFFSSQTEASLEEALKKFKTMTFQPEKITKNAERFSLNKFKERFMSEFEKIVAS